MNKILLVIKREYFSRVKKKSFLLSTILTPLLIPLILGGIIYIAEKDSEVDEKLVVEVLDESKLISFEESSRYEYVYVESNLDVAKTVFQESNDKALLHIPNIDIDDPQGIILYAKTSLSISTSSQSGVIRILIRDTGCGISKEDMAHIFDAFFTTKPLIPDGDRPSGGNAFSDPLVHSDAKLALRTHDPWPPPRALSMEYGHLG